MIYDTSGSGTLNLDTTIEKQEKFVLTDAEVKKLAEWSIIIEEHYGRPMDIEWAKDGLTNELFIVQARPETKSVPIPCWKKARKLQGEWVWATKYLQGRHVLYIVP